MWFLRYFVDHGKFYCIGRDVGEIREGFKVEDESWGGKDVEKFSQVENFVHDYLPGWRIESSKTINPLIWSTAVFHDSRQRDKSDKIKRSLFVLKFVSLFGLSMSAQQWTRSLQILCLCSLSFCL